MSDDVTLKLDGLQKLLKALTSNPPIARVGILGDTTSRSGGSLNNATIGSFHEFGTSKVPVRSFLRVPIATKLENELKKSGAFTPEALTQVIKTKSLKPWVEKVAICAVGVVLDGFDTGGFGDWKPSNMTRKKIKQTLVETQQLRNSITYDIKEK